MLIVEDDFTTRRLLEVVLTGQGYQVHGASDAESGLAILELFSVDLVLLDLVLPRASGVEFLKARRTLDPLQPETSERTGSRIHQQQPALRISDGPVAERGEGTERRF